MQGTAEQRALAGAMQDAIAPSVDAPPLDKEEAHRILIEWNRTERAYDRTETVWGLVEKQAQKHPRRTAVIDGTAAFDYQRLTARANAIASELATRGVTPGSLIGVCMGRTYELVATLLGVLRAGCAYVPLDPKYPHERVRYMLTHARAAAAIVDDERSAALCAGAPQIVRLDAATTVTTPTRTTPTRDTMAGPSASDLAYVIYTSGSTGEPKGVAVEHRSVVAMTLAMRELLDDDELSGVLAAASVCFDPSVMEILGTLSLGGTVVLAENALTLPELPSAHRVRTAIMVPSAMQALLKAGGLPEGVRCVVLGGEVLKPSLAKQLHALPRPPRVVNVYGPTEDTVYSTATEVPAGAETITIGRPVPNARAYILDEAMRPVPVGVPGELHLAGDKLARGYLHDEARTRQRFVEMGTAGGQASHRRTFRTRGCTAPEIDAGGRRTARSNSWAASTSRSSSAGSGSSWKKSSRRWHRCTAWTARRRRSSTWAATSRCWSDMWQAATRRRPAKRRAHTWRNGCPDTWCRRS
ncbi:MAG: amino acid adenylation domain-containing protein [Pseudomonadota bacterium]